MSSMGDAAESEVGQVQMTHPAIASISTVTETEDDAHRENPQFLVMTNPPFFTIAFSDCAAGRNAIPQTIIQPRRSAHQRTRSDDSRVSNSDAEELLVTLRRASDATCSYWKTSIGQYMVHYMRHHDMVGEQFDLGTEWHIYDFPAGYALFTEPRIRSPDKAPHQDHYLFGFDADGERTITFRSPMEFILHGVSLAFGSIADCGCSVCNHGVRQKDIHQMLVNIAQGVTIPKPRRFSIGRPRQSLPSPSPSPTALSTQPLSNDMTSFESASDSKLVDGMRPEELAEIERGATEPSSLASSLTKTESESKPEANVC